MYPNADHPEASSSDKPTWKQIRRYVRLTCDMLAELMREYGPDEEMRRWGVVLEIVGETACPEPQEAQALDTAGPPLA